MPRYFFNTRIGNELILDPEGEELRDPDHAWRVARTTIREILKTEGEQASLLNAILEVTMKGRSCWNFPLPKRWSTARRIPKPNIDGIFPAPLPRNTAEPPLFLRHRF
jgi:hypothetical protein